MFADKNHFVHRCPYCILGREFRPLFASPDGRLICVQCGHTASPLELTFVCACPQCVRLSQAAVRLEHRRAR